MSSNNWHHNWKSGSFDNWQGGLAELCGHFQFDLSCLVDGELDEAAAGRAMLHIEECSQCREFFEDTRKHARLHRDVADPDRLFAHVATLTGSQLAGFDPSSFAGRDTGSLEGVTPDFGLEAENIDLIHRLASIFYQLGKAYTLAAIDPGYSQRIFEDAVQVDVYKDRGRGFVDGVVSGGKGRSAGVDWTHARHMLNGRLEKIEDPLEKGRRLLNEAIEVDPSHEEALLYLAFIDAQDGRTLKAAEQYRQIFDSAVSETNRGLAIIQLGLLYSSEENYKKAASCWRWVTINSLHERDDRFWFVHFNLGMVYANWRQPERSLTYFRELIDRNPSRVTDVVEAFSQSPKLRASIDSQPGFAEALLQHCPELFQAPPPATSFFSEISPKGFDH
jgi:hypothetical protein